MRKGFISISENAWATLEPQLPQCLGITVQRISEHRIGQKLYRTICFSYQVLQDVHQLLGFGVPATEGGHRE